MAYGKSLVQWTFWALCAASLVSVTSSTSLDDLGYTASSDVNDYLNLARDIGAMRAAGNNFATKQSIYTTGSPNRGVNDAGLTLQSLSLNALNQYGKYPMYRIYMAGYDLLGQTQEGDDAGFFDGKPVAQYADTLVNDLFLLNVTNIEAEAALSMNVAMAYYGALYDMLTACKENNQPSAQQALDMAAAFWVGADQVPGDSNTGYFLYNLAQFVGERFNQFGTDQSQSLVNSNVISMFKLIQTDISAGKCINDAGYIEMRDKVKELWGYVNQILVQMLIHRSKTYAAGKPTDFVELYSLALLPQVASCNQDIYSDLLKYTVTLNVDASTEAPLIDTLQKAYSCLGLTCGQVGAYAENSVPACDDSGKISMAGYTPQTDVRNVARIDRDIRQIRWMMQFSAIEAAREYYEYGWNAEFTLQQLARGGTTTTVSSVFTLAQDYFTNSNDKEFANQLIIEVFEKQGAFAQASDEQLQAYIDSLLRGVVIYLAITNELEAAVGFTAVPSMSDAIRSWEAGAALFFGSTEGIHVGGSSEAPGESIYGLANKFCVRFNVCAQSGIAQTNEDIYLAFVNGQSAMDSGQATQLQSIYETEIKDVLIVPVMQAMLWSAIEAGLAPDSADKANLYGYSRMILGEFGSVAPNSAVDIADDTKPDGTPSPTQTNAIFSAMESMLALATVIVPCEKVGGVRGGDGQQRDICQGIVIDAPPLAPTSAAPNNAPQPTPAPVPITRGPTPDRPNFTPQAGGLAFGRFTFTDQSVADRDAQVALDVKEMWNAATPADATVTYTTGGNFLGGVQTLTQVTTLQEMSTLSKDHMAENHIFNHYRFALYNESGLDDTAADTWSFADSVVNQALNSGVGQTLLLSAESTVVLNSYFMILHQLELAASQCKASSQQDALLHLDSAVALWIGSEQEEGKYNSGYMMYSQAQLVMNHYGSPEAEAPANRDLMTIFNEAQSILQQCSFNPEGSYRKMRGKYSDANKQLVKIFAQHWIFYATAGDLLFQSLFNVVLLPQLAACGAEGERGVRDFSFLRQLVISGLFTTNESRDLVLDVLADGLTCLGLTCADLGQPDTSTHADLAATITDLCGQLDARASSTYIAGYEADNQLVYESRYDLDILQINIMMRTNAVNAAKEIYEYGWNSRVDGLDVFQTLQDLAEEATSGQTQPGPLAQLWSTYYNGAIDYPNAFISDIFAGTGSYQSASRKEKAEAVYRMLQTGVTQLVIAQNLDQAIDACTSGGTVDGSVYIDTAAAYFAGSIEGTPSGGSTAKRGVMLMSLGKEFCGAFGKCESGGDATSNELTLFALADMKTYIKEGKCDDAKDIADNNISPLIPVPIIQALLSMASVPTELAELDVYAKSLLPLIDSVNKTSSAFIAQQTEFGGSVITSGIGAMFDAMKFVMVPLGIDCAAVGKLLSVNDGLCDITVVAPPDDTSTNLGDDLYKTTTYVQNIADLAKDIKQMEDDLEIGRKSTALDIYKEGQNSPIYDDSGLRIDLLPLARLSTDASSAMAENPIFQTFVYALEDDNGDYLGAPASQYADSVVMSFFNSEEDKGTLPAEAAVILNIWMEVVNELYQQLASCRNQSVQGDDGIHSIDKVAALYIGDGEIAGNKERGHLLYNLAEVMAGTFGTVDSSGMASANIQILRLLTEARLELSFPQACQADFSTVRKLTRTVNKLVPQLMVPIVQGLINSILTNDRDRVRLYAHGVVPLLKACNEITFDYLYDQLLLSNFAETEVDAVIAKLYDSLFCFGITCDDIGTHQNAETGATCETPSDLAPLAGYRPSREVIQFARLDLDIRFLKILLLRKAYGPAMNLYMFGQHSSGVGSDGSSTVSLQSLATGSGRSVVPEYNTHVQFYGSDNNYADTLLLNAINKNNDLSDLQRTEYVVGVAQYMIMYMAILQSMYQSVADCKSGSRPDQAALNWDKAAAFIIGSMEGTAQEPYAVRPGVFLWGVGKKYCTEFGTCRNIITGDVLVNQEILSLLYTGRGAVGAQSCEALEKASNEMTLLLRVSLFQTAFSELISASEIRSDARDSYHARAYSSAQAILPLISQRNRDNANTISSNLDFEGPLLGGINPGDTVERENTIIVGNALTQGVSDLNVNCELIGATENVQPCVGSFSTSRDKTIPIVIGIVLGAILGAALAVFLFLYKARKARNEDDEKAEFIRNDAGVMDNHSEFDTTESRGNVAVDDMDHGDADAGDGDVQLPEPV